MSVCKQTPKKNVQLVNCPSENAAWDIYNNNKLVLINSCGYKVLTSFW